MHQPNSPRHRRSARPGPLRFVLGFLAVLGSTAGAAGDPPRTDVSGAAQFRQEIQPLLKEFCFDCHGEGANKGGVAFDGFASDQALFDNRPLWLKALKNVRVGLMPPPKKTQPSSEQKQRLEHWIKSAVFAIDPANPDPGRVTVRRLNRVEYKNTIRDLMEVDFDTEAEFPADDSGHGFDNIGDVLTLPPMLLEKYLTAAKSIVTKAVPSVPKVPAEKIIAGRSFSGVSTNSASRTNRVAAGTNSLALSYYDTASVSNTFRAGHEGRYQLALDFTANERFVDGQFDYNKCRLVFKADGRELHTQEYTREPGRAFHYEFDQEWPAGPHELAVSVQPLTPDQKQVRSLTLRLDSVMVRGPLDPTHWVRPKNYERFFPREVPADSAGRRQFAREILEPFLRRAYRRPVDAPTADRLVALAETTYGQPGKTFEAAIGQAMVAVLASPRFLFREEATEPAPARTHPLVDEFALASRLSYFLWSSTPDDELLRLAGEHQLRARLAEQTRRLLADRKSEALVRNFVGQWLQTRDIETIPIDARQVLSRELPLDPDQERRRQRFRELRDKLEETLTPEEKKEMDEIRATFFRRSGQPLRADLTPEVRRAMRQETEKAFDYVVREDRSLL